MMIWRIYPIHLTSPAADVIVDALFGCNLKLENLVNVQEEIQWEANNNKAPVLSRLLSKGKPVNIPILG